jgi:hypothetical protein
VKPLEWRESQRVKDLDGDGCDIGRMLVAGRGPWARAFVWLSVDKDEWVWEIDFGGPHGSTVIDFAPTEEEAKKAAEDCVASIANELLGVEGK